MTQFLINRFVKDPVNVKNAQVRQSFGMLASVVGIVSNFILFAVKLVIGFLLNSVAVMADSVNNLSDCGSSVITIIGFKMGSKPPDKEHPFGHGRLEYFAALGVSMVIIVMGFEFFKSSISKIITPQEMSFSVPALCILILTIFVKMWLSLFNKKIGKDIASNALIATGQDAKNDVIITTVTVVSLLCVRFTGINIDGFAGVVVALVLIKNGFDIAKDSLSPLIGESISKEVANQIIAKVTSYDGIEGVHDLVVHNYGPGRSMATIHAEVSMDANLVATHETIDRAENEILEDMGIHLVIHLDPVAISDPHIMLITKTVMETIATLNPLVTAHEFRLIPSLEATALMFDMEVPHGFPQKEVEAIILNIEQVVFAINPQYVCVPHVKCGFVYPIN